MKKILYDFVPFQDKIINGGSLYAKMILNELLKDDDIEIIGVSTNPELINFELFELNIIKNIRVINVLELSNFINEVEISCFFVAISQRYNLYDLSGLKCKIYIVCHDLFDFSMTNANLFYDKDRACFLNGLTNKKKNIFRKFKRSIFNLIHKKKNKRCNIDQMIVNLGYSNFEKLIKNKNVQVITVSNYSKNSLLYYFKAFGNDVIVFYPPEELLKSQNDENFSLFKSSKKYFLLLSCGRYSKNTYLFYKVFDKWNRMHNNEFEAVFVGIDKIDLPNSRCFKYLKNDELVWLIMNCYSIVYPSFAEGFGQPPVEAMKFGRPVLAAFDTSIPEICGSGALYFNPLYEEDLFFKLNILCNDYDSYVVAAKERYLELSKKQYNDFHSIISIIKGDLSE